MVDLSGVLQGITIDFDTRRPVVSFLLDQQIENADYLQGHLAIKVGKKRNKRSLDSNAYAWALINEIGNVLRLSKEEVYLEMLKRYGQSDLVSVLSSVDVSPYFKYYEVAGTATLNGKEFTHYKVYKGSSEFDSREMAVLIDGIVSEAKTLGIQTLTQNEINELKERWGLEIGNKTK